MSNLFKNTNRFSSLAEDYSSKEKPNDKNKYSNNTPNTKYYNRDSYSNSYSNRRSNERNQKTQIFDEEKRKNKQKIDMENNLKIENFPELMNRDKVNKSVDNSSKESITFLEKLKIQNTPNNNLTNNDDNVEPGWVLLKKEKGTNKTIVKYGFHKECNSQNFTENVLNSLVEMNEKRKKEYIDLWGEDEYEKMFLFPNYDYDYFNRLDELYEEEMETQYQEELERENMNEYTNNGYFEYY